MEGEVSRLTAGMSIKEKRTSPTAPNLAYPHLQDPCFPHPGTLPFASAIVPYPSRPQR